METRFTLLEEKVATLEQQNQKCQEQYNSMWQELNKAKDKEQNLERILFLAFNCISQAGLSP
jgi:chaperonin cofactor prefoldin